jgi:hypothetical protein
VGGFVPGHARRRSRLDGIRLSTAERDDIRKLRKEHHELGRAN